MPQIVKDRQGVEYNLIKANRVNWVVERRSDGRRMKGNAAIFTYDRTEADTTPPINPLFRVGAIVNLLPDCPIVKDVRNPHKAGDFFVIIGFGDVPGEFRIIEAGGNARNQYFKSIHARYLTVEDD
jgi:hypothetical protein